MPPPTRPAPVPTRLAPVPYVPELRLHLADPGAGLFDAAGGAYHSDRPPPFWAFAWAGGQALARYVLDEPASVAGRRVLDLAAGSGIVGIAAARAGAAAVRAVDVDPAATDAIGRNAAANGVAVTAECADVLAGDAGGADVVLAGDAFYSAALAGRMLAFLVRAARAGARVLVADPDRGFLPARRFHPVASYQVPVPPVLEDGEHSRRATIWELS
jgi:predicted nicotinamide N-methyase